MLQEETRVLLPVPLMMVARNWKHYLPSFSMEGTVVEKIGRSEVRSEKWWEMAGMEERK